MFFKYFRPILRPFEKLRMMWVSKKMAVGRVQTDASRVKAYKGRVKGYANDAKSKAGKVKGKAGQMKGKAGKLKGKAGKLKGKAGKAQQNMPGQGKGRGGGPGARGGGPPPAAARSGGAIQPSQPGGSGPPAASGAPDAGGQPAVGNGNGITEKGFLFWKKRICNGCGAKLDKTWDACPYCAQNQPAAAAAPQKTQAFMIDPGGGGGTVQLLGWIIPIAGPQRGELYTLSPVSKVGTDPSCTVCLADSFMSSEHAEIFAEDGVWIVKDLGSTNGTYVNDKRVEKQELVDNDMIKFGQSQVKFKSL